MTQATEAELDNQGAPSPLSLGTAAARNLATTTKSVPQMQGITSRWLLRILPWVQATGGTYRVNRRLSHAVGNGRVSFTNIGDQVQIIAPTLAELPALRDLGDSPVLDALAARFTQQSHEAGSLITELNQAANQVILIAHGKVNAIKPGKYGDATTLDSLSDGDHIGHDAFTNAETTWPYTVKAVTPTTTLSLSRAAIQELSAQFPELAERLVQIAAADIPHQNEHGEASIRIASSHAGEPVLPNTFVDYELSPREYELSVAQTILHVHSRVADLYNNPMNQTEQQLRLTIEALRERQENELVNNSEFGLLHNADLSQRIPTRGGAPTPDDLDDLISVVWKEPSYLLAHPKAIAAFGKECSRRGIYPHSIDVGGHKLPSWRGIPLLPCNKIPITEHRTTSFLLLRVGEEKQGVIGLHQTGLPDEVQPGLSVRFMNINDKAVISYLVTAYYSAAILVPDALGVLEHVELGRDD